MASSSSEATGMLQKFTVWAGGKGSPLSLQELVSSLQASGPVEVTDRDLGRPQGAQRLPWTLDGAAGCSQARSLEVSKRLPEDLRRRAEVEQQAERCPLHGVQKQAPRQDQLPIRPGQEG